MHRSPPRPNISTGTSRPGGACLRVAVNSNVTLHKTHGTPNQIVLALDLEGTLISNAMSQIPRPDLYQFLSRCTELFSRVVMFTTVKEDRFRSIAKLLVEERYAPEWFANIEFVQWQGETKDLNFIPGAHVAKTLLVDDFDRFVHPGQEGQWMQVDYFDYPYPSTDTGLKKILALLEARAHESQPFTQSDLAQKAAQSG